MNRTALLLQTPAVGLWRFDHPPGTSHSDPEWEVSSQDSISFVEEGSFDLCFERRRWRFLPGSIFVARRGMTFSCTHEDDCPTDRCLTVAYDAGTVEELRMADVAVPAPPFARAAGRHEFIRRRLASCDTGEEIRFELLAGALFESLGATAPAHFDKARHLVGHVERAIERIEAEFDRPLSLRDLARTAGLSPYHFARAFREVVGLPPHRYLTAVRLRHAFRMLDGGAGVTHTCYEVGFGSLSHFITTFRDRFGMTPSDVRGASSRASIRAALPSTSGRRRPARVPR